MPWWSFGTRPCCIRLQGLKIEACTRVYPQVSCLQRQAYKRSESVQLAARACMRLQLWYRICQVQQVRHDTHSERWACMELIAATLAQCEATQAQQQAPAHVLQLTHEQLLPELLCRFLFACGGGASPITVQRFRSIPLPPAGCCQKQCGGEGTVQRSQADAGALGCCGGGPLGAQTSLADRQAPAQAAWGTLDPA